MTLIRKYEYSVTHLSSIDADTIRTQIMSSAEYEHSFMGYTTRRLIVLLEMNFNNVIYTLLELKFLVSSCVFF